MFLIGIVSFGEPICGTKRNSVYTKYLAYHEWVKKHSADVIFVIALRINETRYLFCETPVI
ncbi:hypothetical protein B4U80_06461 [Leptotrombidium deliense]|uniref:Peptidase S1 domain-containing protein n=1 Tax=Leptotrombidium deliense TaxID=299467 RepID=A0A443RTU2_9ACAR|nr:hypothetical protein B4U80_06461 [Leptotrombidium deliense]